MTTITIPRSPEAAHRKLAELGQLATATEWHRAAIVAAFVQEREGQGRRTSAEIRRSWESPNTFARRRIVGLTNHETVLVYLRAWLATGRERPRPGSRVELPTEDWRPTAINTVAWTVPEPERRETLTRAATEAGVGVTKVLDVASNPAAVAVALDNDERFAERVAAARAPARQRTTTPADNERIDRPPPDVNPAIDATQSVDYQLDRALTNLHSARVGLEVALRPFAGQRLVPEVAERIRDDRDALDLMLTLVGEPIPDNAADL